MRILRHYNIRLDFWEINPQTESVKEFVDIRDGVIKLETKAIQSQIMWAIALVYDYDSLYFNLRLKERQELIAKDYLNEPEFFTLNDKALKPVVEKYMYLQHDSEKRYLDQWNRKIDEVEKAIDKWKITTNNLTELTDVMKKQKELLNMKEEIMDRIKKAAKGEDLRGGGVLSLIESDAI